MKTDKPESPIKGSLIATVCISIILIHGMLFFWASQWQLRSLEAQTTDQVIQIALISALAPTSALSMSPATSPKTPAKRSVIPIEPSTKTESVSKEASPIKVATPTRLAQSPQLASPIVKTDSASPLSAVASNNNAATLNTQTTTAASTSSQNTSNTLIKQSAGTTPNPVVKIEKPNAFAAHLQNPKPIYPKRSRELGEQGVVVLSIWVDVDGQPSQVRLVKTSGFARLDDAAIRQISEHWRFVPGQKNGQKEAMELIQRIPFTLEESAP